MKYTKPALERTQMMGLLSAPSGCNFVKCQIGYTCIDGECVPI